MFFWVSRRGRGGWQPSPLLQALWAFTKAGLWLTLALFCLLFAYYLITGP